MENQKNQSQEEKHKIAYNKLKEIQHKYGFENIAHLRTFYRYLGKIFLDLDGESSMKGEELAGVIGKASTLFSNFDFMDETQIKREVESFEKELREMRLSESLIHAIQGFYNKRINSEIEHKRREILREEKKLAETIDEYYTKKAENQLNELVKKYNEFFQDVLRFTFKFPTYQSDFSGSNLYKRFYGIDDEILSIVREMRRINASENIIKTFIQYTGDLPDIIEEAYHKQKHIYPDISLENFILMLREMRRILNGRKVTYHEQPGVVENLLKYEDIFKDERFFKYNCLWYYGDPPF